MLEFVPTKQFLKDLTKASKRGKNLEKIDLVIDCLAGQKPLPRLHNEHVLTGNYSKYRNSIYFKKSYFSISKYYDHRICNGRAKVCLGCVMLVGRRKSAYRCVIISVGCSVDRCRLFTL